MNGCGLAMLVWLISPCYINVVNHLYFDYLYCCTHIQLYNCPLPSESLILYLSVQPLQFLEVPLMKRCGTLPTILASQGPWEKAETNLKTNRNLSNM